METATHDIAPNKRRRWIVAATIVIAAVVAIGGTAAALNLAPSAQKEDEGQAPSTTGEVTRGDISERVRTTGRLGLGATTDIGSSLPGTVTWIAEDGSTVERGGELFRIDDFPVVLLLGALPAWRPFASGMESGRDVLQLEQNLRDLGYFDHEPNEKFTWATTEAIMAWQEDRGLDRTGQLPLGSVVFETGAVRIVSSVSAVGSPGGGAIVSVAGTTKILTVDLDPALSGSAQVGTSVDVALPNGGTTSATISTVGSPVERETSESKALRIPLVLTLDDPAATGDLIEVSVAVDFVKVLATDVLRVPVAALLAGPDGATEIEVLNGSKISTHRVELGASGDGLIEVSGEGISEGDQVVVAE